MRTYLGRQCPSLERLEDRVVPSATYLGEAILANATTAFGQFNPAVATDPTGKFVVVWEANQGGGPGIVAQRFDAAGVAVGGEIVVHAPSQFTDVDPAVAMDAAGNFVVAWFNFDNLTVRARAFAADGTPVGAEFVVATIATTPFDPQPSVAVTPTGFVVAWDNNDSRIHATRYDASGTLLGEVNLAVGRPVELPRVGADALGNFVVTYANDDDLGAGTVSARRFDAAGVAVGDEIEVSPDATNRTPEIAVEADGDFVIAWSSAYFLSGPTYGVFARLYNADGTPRTDPLKLDSPLTSSEENPSVGVDGSGNFVAAWEAAGDSYAVRGSAAGFTYGASFRVAATAGVRGEPSVAVSGAADRFVIAWEGSATSTDIFAQRFEVGPNHAPILDPSGDPTFTFVAQNATGPHGDTVASLLGTSVTDADLGALQGVAVVGLTGTAVGTWEFSLDGGTTWAPVGAASETNARLLRSSDLLRFVPSAGFLGTATVTYRAWDWTQGTFGGVADMTVLGTGGATAFSTATETATLTVTPTGNHAPVLDTSGSPMLTDVPLNQITSGNSVAEIVGASITDRNHDALEGVAVVGVTGGGTWEYSTNGGFSWTAVGAVSPSSALLLRDLDRLRFVPDAEFAGTATVTYHAWDETTGTPGGRLDVSVIDAVNGPVSVALEMASVTVTRFHLVGNLLNVYGTHGDDTFSFVPDATVTLNGETRTYPTGFFTPIGGNLLTIVFHGRGGTDTANVDMRRTAITGGGVSLWGVADLYEDYARITKASRLTSLLNAFYYDITLSDVENVYLSAAAGDRVNLYDSAGNDTFVSTPTYAYLSMPNSFFVVTGVAGAGERRATGFVQAYSRYGNDAAWFYDSAGNDAFYANAATGTAYMAGGGFFNCAYGFEVAQAVATAGGSDTAYFYDGIYDDYFVGGAASSTLTGPGYAYRADGFDLILAQALAGGVDLATILDPSRNVASGFRTG